MLPMFLLLRVFAYAGEHAYTEISSDADTLLLLASLMLLFIHRSNVPVVANIYAATGIHDVAGIITVAKRCICSFAPYSLFYGWRPTVAGVPHVACVIAIAC
jgi:hypothetical protein